MTLEALRAVPGRGREPLSAGDHAATPEGTFRPFLTVAAQFLVIFQVSFQMFPSKKVSLPS